MANSVAIVGRPNVGKSTLFNRLTESRKAIVDETSGVTRDRHYGKVDWNGRDFSVIDTGGYIMGSDDIFEKEIQRQVQLAIDEANIIVFVVDVPVAVVLLVIVFVVAAVVAEAGRASAVAAAAAEALRSSWGSKLAQLWCLIASSTSGAT